MYMKSELPARLPGVAVAVARGADLIRALLRTRFLAVTPAALAELAELASESAQARLPCVFFGALPFGYGGTLLESASRTDEDDESDSFLASTRACVADRLE